MKIKKIMGAGVLALTLILCATASKPAYAKGISVRSSRTISSRTISRAKIVSARKVTKSTQTHISSKKTRITNSTHVQSTSRVTIAHRTTNYIHNIHIYNWHPFYWYHPVFYHSYDPAVDVSSIQYGASLVAEILIGVFLLSVIWIIIRIIRR